MASLIVPETPEPATPRTPASITSERRRRRSFKVEDAFVAPSGPVTRRRSSALKIMGSVEKRCVAATPESREGRPLDAPSAAKLKSFVDESPDPAISQDATIIARARKLGIDNSKSVKKIQGRRKSTRLRSFEHHQGLAEFEEIVAETQSPVSGGKQLMVRKWLSDQSPSNRGSFGQPPKLPFVDYFLDKDQADVVPTNILNFSEDSSDSSAEAERISVDVSKILDNLDRQSQEMRDSLPKPPSFQNFSTESAELAIKQIQDVTNCDVVEIELDKSTSTGPKISLSSLLDGVVAHVEVRTKNENRSSGVECQLLQLGARVSKTFHNDVTHLIFKDGSLATYRKAKRLGIHIVSVSWIEGCKKSHSRLPEADYPCSSKEKYESPGLFPKLRKAKSMQPKTDEEDEKAMELKLKRMQAARRRREKKAEVQTAPAKMKSVSRHPVPLDYYKQPEKERRKSVLEVIQEYQTAACSTPKRNGSIGEMTSPCTSEELDTPLVKRLAFKLMRENGGSPTSPSCSSFIRRKITMEDYDSDGEKSQSFQGDVENSKPDGNSKRKRNQSPTNETEEAIEKTKAIARTQRKRHVLFSQADAGLFSETPPAGSPKSPEKPTSTATSTKLVRTRSDRLVAHVIKKQAKQQLQTQTASKSSTKKVRTQTKLIDPPRRSSADFVQPNKEISQGLGSSQQRNGRSEIVFTSCGQEDIDLGRKLAGQYSTGFVKQPFVVPKHGKVTASTTHVVSGDTRRTLSILQGILRGCWVLSKSWIYESLENGKWVDEEPFELANFSPAVVNCRMDRQAFGSSYKSTLFSECGSILVTPKKTLHPSRVDLQGLIRLGGGSVANLRRVAKILVGEMIESDHQICVNEKWILDSIQFNVVMPFDDYKIS